MDEKLKQIQEFWHSRAIALGNRPQATLEEGNLRKLEERTICRFLTAHSPRFVLDIGCGNGCSTRIYAGKLPAIEFVGVDNCPAMIDLANSRKRLPNCHFQVADLVQPESLPARQFDLIISQRCLQNLPDYDCQRQAIRALRTLLSPHGMLFLVEGTRQGVSQMQEWRRKTGKEPLVNIEPWYNCFLDESRLQKDFEISIFPFASSYFFLTRIFHQRLSLLARMMPAVGNFGYVKAFCLS